MRKEGTAQLNVLTSKEFKKEVERFALEKDMNLKEVVIAALNHYMAKK